jgi:hypothetical protein
MRQGRVHTLTSKANRHARLGRGQPARRLAQPARRDPAQEAGNVRQRGPIVRAWGNSRAARAASTRALRGAQRAALRCVVVSFNAMDDVGPGWDGESSDRQVDTAAMQSFE